MWIVDKVERRRKKKKKYSIVHEYFQCSDDAQASKCNIYNFYFI